MPFLPDLDAMKMAKIKECCEKAFVCGKSSGPAKPKAAVANDVKETTAKPAEAAQKKPGAVIKKPTPAASGSGPPKKTAGKPVAKKPAGAGAKVEEYLEKELSAFTIFTGGQPEHQSLESSDNILSGFSRQSFAGGRRPRRENMESGVHLPSTRCRIQQSEVTTFAVRQLPQTSYPPVRRVEEQSDCHRSGPSDCEPEGRS
jgi:hypothetical protein